MTYLLMSNSLSKKLFVIGLGIIIFFIIQGCDLSVDPAKYSAENQPRNNQVRYPQNSCINYML